MDSLRASLASLSMSGSRSILQEQREIFQKQKIEKITDSLIFSYSTITSIDILYI